MAPVVRALDSQPDIENFTCVTGQHRGLLDQVLKVFGIEPDIDLDVMEPGQQLARLTSRVLTSMDTVLSEIQPDAVLVHGDTTTSFATALASFYAGIPVAHVEAGLRTRDLLEPFPEELNRQGTARIARWNFAPTEEARYNLRQEHIDAGRIWVVGNTIVDALTLTVDRIAADPRLRGTVEGRLARILGDDWHMHPVVLVTAHRRENLGVRLESICQAIVEIAFTFPNLLLVYPVHPNPAIIATVRRMLGNLPNMRLVEPLEYPEFVWLLNAARLVLTDSGGVQEEAPILGKPVLLMRESTERPEGVDAGVVKLVGTDKQTIVAQVGLLMTDTNAYERMSRPVALLGDGSAAKQIVATIAATVPEIAR